MDMPGSGGLLALIWGFPLALTLSCPCTWGPGSLLEKKPHSKAAAASTPLQHSLSGT